MTLRIPRREFLRRSTGAALALPTAAAVLAACSRSVTPAPSAGPAQPYELARKDNPVTLPLVGEPIDSGQPVEKGSTLAVFGWPLYVKPGLVARFEKTFDVRVVMNEFETMDAAIAELRTGQTRYDVFFPGVDVVGKLVSAEMLQPLNRDYLSNLTNVWDSLQDPFYDQGSRYTVPYFVWTTGTAWRNDRIPDDKIKGSVDPYGVFWDRRYRGHTHLLNGSREALAMALMKNGIHDVNTDDPAHIATARDDLLTLVDNVEPVFDHIDYEDLFADVYLHQSWSGNIGFARFYAPQPSDISKLSYWWPPDGGTGFPGVVGSDTMAVLRGAASPVAAHAFINFLLDPDVALENSSYEGYQPPQKTIDAQRVVDEGVLPNSLRNVIVEQSDFDTGDQILELSPVADQMWQEAYQRVVAGV